MASDTDLALRRTFLAHDRTLMAWIRTSTSLISFGFTIYKFFQFLVQSNEVSLSNSIFGPRRFALMMISVGVVGLLIATVDHRHTMKALEEEYGAKYRSITSALAAFIVVMGVGFLIVVLLHL